MINIIAAMSKNRVIGSNGGLPWNFPEDISYFKKTTDGHVVIIGRKTFESIGCPLLNRYNIVVSNSKSKIDGVCCATNFEDALDIAKKYVVANKKNTEIFLCGGQSIYEQGLEYTQKIYLTEMECQYSGDRYFPEFSLSEFKLIKKTHSKNSPLSFCVYERMV